MADLDPRRIATVALAVLDKQGVAGFTMRAVATALDVTPMALYHHVRDKEELVTLMMDVANTEMELPPPTGDWREDLWLMARMSRESMLAHAAFMQLRRAYRAWTPSVLRLTERWVTLWQQSGLNLQNAVRAAAASSVAVIGLVHEETIFQEMDVPSGKMLALLPSARALFDAKIDPASQFEITVRSLIDGLHVRLTQDQASAVVSSKTTAARKTIATAKAKSTKAVRPRRR